MNSAQWLLLDNLCNGWPYTANLSGGNAKKAMRWAVKQGYAADGRITEKGQGFFLLNRGRAFGGANKKEAGK